MCNTYKVFHFQVLYKKKKHFLSTPSMSGFASFKKLYISLKLKAGNQLLTWFLI